MFLGSASAAGCSKTSTLTVRPPSEPQTAELLPADQLEASVETMGEWHKVKLQDGTIGWMHDSVVIIAE